MTSEKSMTGWYFLATVIGLYGILLALNSELFTASLKAVYSIAQKIAPIFILVFVLLVVVNYFIDPKKLSNLLGEKSGKKGWLIAVGSGILSTGPIYMWYPLLNELQKQGTRNGLIATFLYNRAVKPALLPLMFFYFGLKFVVVLTVIMILVSILQGLLVEKFVGVIKK